MEMDLLNEWKKATEEHKEFDLFHFSTLLQRKITKPVAEQIMQSFDKKVELVRRLLEYEQDKNTLSDIALLELVKLDVIEKNRLWSEINIDKRLDGIFENLSFQFMNNDDFLSNSGRFDDPITIEEVIGDHVSRASGSSEKNDWIMEAFYGLTQKPELVWYLGKPLCNSSFNPDLYFNIWKNSGDYYIGGNVVYILNDGKS